MNTHTQAIVRKCPETGAWIATAIVLEDGAGITRAKRTFSESHPEAVQWAIKLRDDLDRELVDEVHASRASRRENRP